VLIRELTELLRLTCEETEAATDADADYELTSEPLHRITVDTIERLGRKQMHVVKCQERSLVC